MHMNYAARLDRLREAAGLNSGAVDAVILVPGTNFVYFMGLEFHLSERPTLAILTREGLSMIVPFLEMQKLALRPDLGVHAFAWRDEVGYAGTFAEAIDALSLRGKKIGVDGLTMRVFELLALQAVDPTLHVIGVERACIGVRAIKTAEEVAAMQQAVDISEAALGKLLQEVKPGMTELQIAARLDALMTELGAHGKAFNSLVQTGENSANPHGSATDRVLQAGEFLLIDWGAQFDGYLADSTRTVCIGEPSPEMQKIYDTVLAANTAAKAAVKPGVTMGAIDKAARDVITAAGYGEYFTHRTGHGLGMDGHEPIPQIAAGVNDVLQPGMTFTIEPGIYVPELGGVRIEDDVLVTDDGARILTQYPRELKL